MLEFVIVLLAILLFFALTKWLILRREVRNITRTIARIHGKATNERVTVGAQDRGVAELAGAVNALFEDVYRERGEHRVAMDEMRRSMANISHDLRTPLTSIIGYVKLLQSGADSPEQSRHYLDTVYAKASSLAKLVANLFELARLEAGAYQFELERVNAGEILSEELAGFYDALTAGGAEPAIALSHETLWIIGDKSALSRVFANLLQNMVKYGASGVDISSALDEGMVVLRFSNRAQGLREGDAAQLFERFFTADRMRTGEGTGLGLAVVKELVEQMSGTIRVALAEETLTFTLRWKAASL